MANERAAISVVIPSRNAGAYFADVLAGINKQENVELAGIVVADSRSTDRTRTTARRFNARVVDVDPARFNHGATRLEAVRQTRAPLVVLMTQDALLRDARLFEKLAAHFADARVGGAYARQTPRRDLDALANARWQRLNRQEERVVTQEAPPEGIDALPPATQMQLCTFDNVCSMIRREVVDAVPFRATAFAEDRLWARDALCAGWKIVYDGTLSIVHSHAPGVRARLARAFVNHRAMYQYFGYRFVRGPLGFLDYVARAAYGGLCEARRFDLSSGRALGEAAAEAATAFAALAGLCAGIRAGRV